MGDGIQINRMAESFSSHTLARPRRSGTRTRADAEGLRQRLIEAMVEAVAEGSDPRLAQSRARL